MVNFPSKLQRFPSKFHIFSMHADQLTILDFLDLLWRWSVPGDSRNAFTSSRSKDGLKLQLSPRNLLGVSMPTPALRSAINLLFALVLAAVLGVWKFSFCAAPTIRCNLGLLSDDGAGEFTFTSLSTWTSFTSGDILLSGSLVASFWFLFDSCVTLLDDVDDDDDEAVFLLSDKDGSVFLADEEPASSIWFKFSFVSLVETLVLWEVLPSVFELLGSSGCLNSMGWSLSSVLVADAIDEDEDVDDCGGLSTENKSSGCLLPVFAHLISHLGKQRYKFFN